MRDPFAQAAKSVLALLGKDALLRGLQAGKVNVEHGVEVYERSHEGESMFTRSISSILKQYEPKRGDELVLLDSVDGSYSGTPTARYRIDGVFADNGFVVRHVVTPMAL